jgi:hypothetical protein
MTALRIRASCNISSPPLVPQHVIPAQAGIHSANSAFLKGSRMDPCSRGNDVSFEIDPEPIAFLPRADKLK